MPKKLTDLDRQVLANLHHHGSEAWLTPRRATKLHELGLITRDWKEKRVKVLERVIKITDAGKEAVKLIDAGKAVK
jgi:hypothetical protein